VSERAVLSIAIVTLLAGMFLYGAKTGTVRIIKKPAVLSSTPWVVAVWLLLVVVIIITSR
jgi:hypothetical protein